ncbi:hypothetical protein RYX36_036545, partial [Vicia faba]
MAKILSSTFLFNWTIFYNVIGVLQEVVKTQMRGGGKKSCVNITLRDTEGNVIEVPLWDDFAKQFMNYQNPDQLATHTIVILTHAWCKQNTISGLPSLSNAWNCSRLYINLEHPQVESFKASFGTTDLANQYALSLTRDSFIHSTNKNWTSPKEVKSIREIYEGGKLPSSDGILSLVWAANLLTSHKALYFTVTVELRMLNPFKIEIEVEYDSHKGTFVFLDKDCKPCTKMTAKELRQLMKEQISDASIMDITNKEPMQEPNQPIMAVSFEQSFLTQASSAVNQASSPTTSSSSTPAKKIAITTSVNNLLEAEDLTPKQSATKKRDTVVQLKMSPIW